eukprot:159898_1
MTVADTVSEVSILALQVIVIIALLFYTYRTIQSSSQHRKFRSIFIFYQSIACIPAAAWTMIQTSASLSNTNASWYKIIFIIGLIGETAFLISICYFEKRRFENMFKDTFFQINKCRGNFYFLIVSISILVPHILLVFKLFNPQINTQISQIILIFVLVTYYMIYFITFCIKCYKFIIVTKNNNRHLSLEMNQRLVFVFIKKLNLSFITIIATIIFVSITFSSPNVYAQAPEWSTQILWNLMYLFTHTIILLCQLLDFKQNLYTFYCTFCHSCVKIIWNCTEQKNEITSISPLLINNDPIPLLPSEEHKSNENSCWHGNECDIIRQMCILLKTHNECRKKTFEDDAETTKTIMNNFHHLLLYHDSDETFHYIHSTLNKDVSHHTYEHCQIHSRHYSRRSSNILNEVNNQNNDTAPNNRSKIDTILDKIHDYYYHSYDTHLRFNLFEAYHDNDTLQQIHQTQKKKKKNNQENTVLVSSKFNTETDSTIYEMYGQGQRFEYDDEKTQWFVSPKYESIKTEILQNKIICVPMEYFQEEYDKCECYINTDYARVLQNLEIVSTEILFNCILALLVYCNCDDYQTVWSSAFRKKDTDETDEKLKERHSHFYFCSKYLRTLVEEFGNKLVDEKNKSKNLIFYHGVSKILYFKNIKTVRFFGPSSTSTEQNVALRFTYNTGMVFQLMYSSSEFPSKARYFDCSFFSDYVNEKECLFVGGIPIMSITNAVRVSGEEMEICGKYMTALRMIVSIFSGEKNDEEEKYDVSSACEEILEYCTGNINIKIPDYVRNSCAKYFSDTKSIMIMSEDLSSMKILSHATLPFVNLYVVMNLMPNIKQIEYYKSFQAQKKRSAKKIIKQISSYITEYVKKEMNTNLKYIIFHHQIGVKYNFQLDDSGDGIMAEYLKACVDSDTSRWDLYTDENKIIFFKHPYHKTFDINSMKLNYDKILKVEKFDD